MVNDTHSGYGTARRYFGDWYANGGSPIAGKTGTNNSTKFDPVTHQNVDDEGNSALWFVGITPNLVSAAAVVNPQHPTQRISNVPGISASNDGTDIFGATAARFWLMAYQPTLQAQQWSWPTPDSAPGEDVPSVVNRPVNDAITELTQAGYKVRVLSSQCGSKVPADEVAFEGPKIAEQGATITLCASSGEGPTVFQPPTGGGGPGSSGSPSSPPPSSSPSPSKTKPKPSPTPTKKHH
jgi:membrane peptidoglycan carboxypeptidase